MKRLRFTLIELLVVVAIIAVLFAMLMPSLKSARDMAKRISCVGNMKNFSLNAAMYLNDYNNRWFYWQLPDGHFWWSGDANPPVFPMPSFNSAYLKIKWKSGDYTRGTLFNCPAKGPTNGYNGSSMDYMYNGTLAENSYRGWYFMNAKVKYPTKTPVFGETIRWSDGVPNSHFFYCWVGTYNWSPPDGGRTFNWVTHLGMDNFVFADGHIASHRQNQSLDKNIFVWDTRQE